MVQNGGKPVLTKTVRITQHLAGKRHARPGRRYVSPRCVRATPFIVMLGRAVHAVAAAARSAGTGKCSTTPCLQRWRGLRLHTVQRRGPCWLPAAGAGAARFLSSSADGGDNNLGDDFVRWGFKSRDEVLRILAADRQVSQQMSFRYAPVEIRVRCLPAEASVARRAHAHTPAHARSHTRSHTRALFAPLHSLPPPLAYSLSFARPHSLLIA